MRTIMTALLLASLLPAAGPAAAQQRRWDGTAPFCAGTCGAGEVEITRRSTAPAGGDPLLYQGPPFGQSCATGTKALCERRARGASCRWDGTAPFCKGSCRSNEVPAPPPPGSSSGKSCWSGRKVYCCTK